MGSLTNTRSIVAQLDSILGEYERAVEAAGWDDAEQRVIPTETLHALVTRCVAAIERAAPRESAYAREAAQLPDWPDSRLRHLVGVIRALRADYAGDYLQSVETLIHADVFDDFVDMASELLAKGYKDPAAVIGGAVLEEHLRKLTSKVGLPVVHEGKPIKADRLNANLGKSSAYNVLDQKNITAWLDLRNKAAHGDFGAYDHGHVDVMLQGIRGFLARNPA